MSDVNLRKYIPAVILVILLGIAFLAAGQRGEKQESGIVYNTGQEKDTGTAIKETKSEEETVKPNLLIKVYVCGYVNVPDVYELPAGSRIKDAVEMAGGFTEDAVGETLNLAGYIEDGQRIYVPCAGDLESGGDLQAEESGISGRVNINKAGMDELMTLPGIGEAKAKSIIKYRETHGDFKSAEALKNVGGIKEGVYASLYDLITVD